MHMSSSAALFLLPIRPEDPEPAVRVKIAMTLIQARVSQPRSVQGMAHALGIATPQVLGLIKDYAVQWRPPFLIASMSYFDILNVGVEMTAPACGANNVRPHAAPVACASHRRGTHTLHRWTFTRRTLPPCCCLRAPSCCASRSGASLVTTAGCASCWLTRRARRVVYAAVVRSPLNQGRATPLVVAGIELLPAAAPPTEAQMIDCLHRFKTRCLKNCFWLLMLLYPGVCKKARRTPAVLHGLQHRVSVEHMAEQHSAHCAGDAAVRHTLARFWRIPARRLRGAWAALLRTVPFKPADDAPLHQIRTRDQAFHRVESYQRYAVGARAAHASRVALRLAIRSVAGV